MSNVSIFTRDIPVTLRSEGVSELTKSLARSSGTTTSRRIAVKKTSFVRMVNGEEVGKTKGEINVVIVNALPKVSRQFYATAYDPNAQATLPDCWSNLGDVPDPSALNAQASNCNSCTQNIAGSGGGTRRACAYQRRIAVVLENDMEGEVYQMNIASTSLFGKGEGNTHPFESYSNYLIANNESIDRVVTSISIDEDADQIKLFFTPTRHLTDEEEEVAIRAGNSIESKNAVRLTVAAQDGVRRLPAAVAKQQLEDDFAPAPKAKVIDVEEVIDEPTKRQSSKPVAPPSAKQNLADVIGAWSEEE